MTLDEMLSTPGFYEVALRWAPGFFRVEVDDQLNCHQLTPEWQRDGILAREGWEESCPGGPILAVKVEKPS